MIGNRLTLDEKSIHTDISQENLEKAILIGERRANSYKSGGYGTPRGKSLERVMQEGAVGEMMVSQHYNAQFDERIIDGGDNGADMTICGDSVDVKVSTHPSPELLVKASKLTADVYVLVHLNCSPSEPIPLEGMIVGYERAEELEKLTPGRFYSDIMNYRVDWKGLKKMPSAREQ